MTKVLIKIVLMVSVLSLPVGSFGAEAVRLRHAASVYVDDKGGGFKAPEGVACGEGTSLIIADTGNGRLVKFTFQNGTVSGGEQIRAEQIAYPLRLQTNAVGEIFVLDGKQRRIVRLGPDGVFKGYIDPAGLPVPEAFVPRSFKLDSAGNIYVLDIFSGRVLIMDPSGKYLRHLDFPAKYGFFSDLAVDSRGTVFLLDSVDAMVYSAAKDATAFAPLSKKLDEFVNFPAGIVVDSRGTIFLADQNGSGVVVLGQDGAFLGRSLAFGWKDGLVRYPAQLCTNDKGEFFVADRENSRIQIFTVFR